MYSFKLLSTCTEALQQLVTAYTSTDTTFQRINCDAYRSDNGLKDKLVSHDSHAVAMKNRCQTDTLVLSS